MKKSAISFMIAGVWLLLGGSDLTFAQITVTVNDAPSVSGTYFEMSYKDTVDVNLGDPGVNKYWDFSGIPLPQKSYWQVVDYATSPFAYRFTNTNANLVYKVTYDKNDTVTYNYARLTDKDLTELGRGKLTVSEGKTVFTEISVGKRATPKLLLPATYGDPEWSSVLEIDTTMLGFAVTVKDSSYSKIDAWGTIKTQFGEFPCLRIRQNHSRFAHTLFGAIPLEININYFWVTNKYGILATVTGFSDITNSNPNPNYSKAKSIDIMTAFLPSAVKDVAEGEMPKEFALFQNYPNPFNPSTTISYQLDEPAEVILKVFNIAGQEVRLLFHTKQEPGRYELQWDAGDLPSGVYYYQIQANDKLLTRKCLLLK